MSTLFSQAAQDRINGLFHLLLELRAWLQVLLDEAVQLLGGHLGQIPGQPRGGAAGGTGCLRGAWSWAVGLLAPWHWLYSTDAVADLRRPLIRVALDGVAQS